MNQEFMQAIDELEKQKGISKETLLEAIENALISAYKKDHGANVNIRVEIDRVDGQFKVLAEKTVVEELLDDQVEIALDSAKKINKLLDIGDITEVDVTPKTFGRIAAQTAKQVVVQRIREAERDMVLKELVGFENDIVSGVIERIEKQNVLVEIGKFEALLMAKEQVQGESYKIGDRIKVYVVEVKSGGKEPQIIISRTHPGLVKRLFEQEVPEIKNGMVEIKSISREAGSRTKIAVCSKDPNVDPIGSCVGQKGNRVQMITDELQGEKIDIIKWDPDINKFITAALSPAKVISVEVDEKAKSCRVTVPEFQLSLAIGKEGQNARLAAKLTNWKIDIKGGEEIE